MQVDRAANRVLDTWRLRKKRTRLTEPMARRRQSSPRRLALLLGTLRGHVLAPQDHFKQLRDELAEFNQSTAYSECRTMGDLVATNIEVMLAGL